MLSFGYFVPQKYLQYSYNIIQYTVDTRIEFCISDRMLDFHYNRSKNFYTKPNFLYSSNIINICDVTFYNLGSCVLNLRIIWISKYVFNNLKQLYIIFIDKKLKLSIYLFTSKITSTHRRQNEDTVVTIQKELQIILLPMPLKKVSSKDQKNGQTTLITQFTPGHDRSRSRSTEENHPRSEGSSSAAGLKSRYERLSASSNGRKTRKRARK